MLLRGQVPDATFAAATAVVAVGLAVAWVIFHRAEYQFAEHV